MPHKKRLTDRYERYQIAEFLRENARRMRALLPQQEAQEDAMSGYILAAILDFGATVRPTVTAGTATAERRKSKSGRRDSNP